MKHLSRVLAGVDFSRPARAAFEQALAISARHGAELVVVHAVAPDEPFSRQGRWRRVLLDRLREKAARLNVPFKERVQTGDAAEILLLHARSLQPDLIVVGTHQRRGLDRLRLGSVGERVATRATVPVLIIPRRGNATGPFRHVAVAVDFGAASDRAIEQALALATAEGDRITLLHAVPGFSAGVPRRLHRFGAGQHQNQLVHEARRQLQVAVPVTRETSAAIHTRVLIGDATTEIHQAVDRIGADLLVVGVPTRGIVPRSLFGTTAARLLRMTSVPLLAVPETTAMRSGDEFAVLERAS